MYKKFIKRILDILISVIVLIVLSPIYLIIAIVIKMVDKGPIIFKQERTGKGGKNFRIYKFKTMKHGQITKLRKSIKNNFT